MLTRITLAISALALSVVQAQAASVVPAQAGTSAGQAQVSSQADLVHVAIETDKGRILLALDRGRAPISTANFLRYVDAKRFDAITFYRAMPYGDGGLIQGGITRDARLLFPPIAHEPSSKSGIPHEAGTILFANAGPGTARADFFITTVPIPFGDDFAPFGRVVEGMEVVKAIFASPVSATKGAGAMKGQMLEPAIAIRSARRVANP
jgi:peptidyl-prolyl cis-trans isomerase A (cyclophilin A)